MRYPQCAVNDGPKTRVQESHGYAAVTTAAERPRDFYATAIRGSYGKSHDRMEVALGGRIAVASQL